MIAKSRPLGIASAMCLAVLLVGCGDPGPVDDLTDENLSLTIPAALEAWPTEAGDEYWEATEMDDGREALLHVGPRGSDNNAAWTETGWRIKPFPPSDARAACAIFLELVATNMESGAGVNTGGAAMADCIETLRPGQNITQTWPITLDNDSAAKVTVTMRSREGPGDYWVSIGTSEG